MPPPSKEFQEEMMPPLPKEFEEKINKVCVVYRNNDLHEYWLFVIDVSGGGGSRDGAIGSGTEVVSLRYPTLRFDIEVFRNPYLCIIGSRLYTFSTAEPQRIFEFQLPSSDEANIKLDMGMVLSSCNMRHPKKYPVALASPDGRKVIVFSSMIDKSDKGAFELYDPTLRSFSILPRIPAKWFPDHGIGHYIVGSCNFISVNVLLLDMEFGYLTINIGHSLPRWKKLKNFFGGRIPTSFTIVPNDICLTPHSAYNVMGMGLDRSSDTRGELLVPYTSIYRWIYLYPDSSDLPDDYEYPVSQITRISTLGEDFFSFCILKTGGKQKTETHMILDVYHCNLSDCISQLSRNREKEEEEQRVKTDQINTWYHELPEYQYSDKECVARHHEYERKRDDLLCKRNRSYPLPSTIKGNCVKLFTPQPPEHFVFLAFFSTVGAGRIL